MERHSPKRKAPKAGWNPAKGAKSSRDLSKQLQPQRSTKQPSAPLGLVKARCPDGQTIVLRGQEGKTLLALVRAGSAGCTAQEVSDWSFRFAAYVFQLLHRFGLVIETVRERHPGGWHGRYVLLSKVNIVEVGR